MKNYLIGLLIWCTLTLPMLACQCRSKTSSIKTNMHTLQFMLETYAVDWGGVYPRNIRSLRQEAIARGYWEEFTNPYINPKGSGLSGLYEDFERWREATQYKVFEKRFLYGLRVRSEEPPDMKAIEKKYRGMLIYEWVSEVKYYIYGLDGKGQLIRDYPRKKVFVLTNA